MSRVGLGSNCPNCGAPRHGNKCEYCGTIFQVEPVNYYMPAVASYGANMSTLDALRQELAQAQCNLVTMARNQYLMQSCNSITFIDMGTARNINGRIIRPKRISANFWSDR